MWHSDSYSGYVVGQRETTIAETESDFFGGLHGHAAERALMAALLFDGAQSYLAYVASSSEAQKSRYREAYAWVHRNDPDYIFSFDSVCEALGLDPSYVRLGLINAGTAARVSSSPWKRTKRY